MTEEELRAAFPFVLTRARPLTEAEREAREYRNEAASLFTKSNHLYARYHWNDWCAYRPPCEASGPADNDFTASAVAARFYGAVRPAVSAAESSESAQREAVLFQAVDLLDRAGALFMLQAARLDQ